MATVRCQSCNTELPYAPHERAEDRLPCPECGSMARHFEVAIHDELRLHEDIGVKHKTGLLDRTLPEKGITRSYQGTRVGRDGRLVRRTAVYDPHRDLAEERVVDAETGDVIVDKTESMKVKYARERGWKPNT